MTTSALDKTAVDRQGWAVLASSPVAGWPAAEIVAAIADTPELASLVPIDRLGMLTDRNPGGLYLPSAKSKLTRPPPTRQEAPMGPYCNFCGARCFLLRVLRDGRTVLLATCSRGMERDRARVSQDHTTALNPVTDRDAVEQLRAELVELAEIARSVADSESHQRADGDADRHQIDE